LTEENPRTKLFERLDTVLDTSLEKFKMTTKKDDNRLAWGRLLVNASNSYGKLLDTEELEQRVAKLEEQFKDSVVIPNEQKSKGKNR